MITTIQKKKRTKIAPLLNQFGKLGEAMTKAAPAVAEHATKIVRQMPVESSFVERLNLMIYAGASFDVSVDDFEIVGAENLTDAEKDFLPAHKPEILCTLQQCLLKKYLSPFDLEMFIDEVRERSAIISNGETLEPPLEVLNEIVRDWFADTLEEMAK